MRERDERGFTLIEIMITVAIVGVLAAIAIPLFMKQTEKARGVEATLQLTKIARSSNEYFSLNHAFPMQAAEVLPDVDGGACTSKDHRFAPSSKWTTDPTWSAIDFTIGERAQFSYHYEATGPTSVHAWAVGDPTCSGVRVQYDLYIEGRADGSTEWVVIDPSSKGKISPPKPMG